MNTRKPVVIGIGELLWDMLPGGKRAGGAPVNFVYHASCLGANGYAISAVGTERMEMRFYTSWRLTTFIIVFRE
jgi:sugar/nucleoside kinase (ribokinase family)